MRSLSHKSLVLSLLALSGCVLDQYSFTGRDGAADDGATAMDRPSADAAEDAQSQPDALSDSGVLPDVQATDVLRIDANDGAVGRDAAAEAGVPCNPAEAVPANAVFVDGSRLMPGDGSNISPYQTIAEAITAIESAEMDRPIVLAPSVYGAIVQFVNTMRNHRIVGGFSRSGGSWTRACGAAIDSWVIGGNSDQAVYIANTAMGTVTFERVAFRTRIAPPAGVSQYGIWASSPRELTLREVDLSVSRGGAGVTPSAPAMSVGVVSCNRSVCEPTANAGRAGGPGASGPAATRAGTVNAMMGFVPSNGTAGGLASAGYPGAPGTAGTPLSTNCASCSGVVCDITCAGVMQPACGAQMQRRCSVNPATLAATAGQCGCGGIAGVGGPGGGGGHSAIGLFAAPGASVRIENSVLRTGPGGIGAVGSVGGLGAMGAPGAGGMAQSCETQCDPASNPCNCIARPGTTVRATAGTAGGVGGSGGQGGAGGAGAGGSSIVIARSTSATVRYDSSVSLVPGAAGMGGVGASGMGAVGQSVPELTY